eukprot:6687702-Prorocentrum_lima.AAC.1
MTRTNREVTQFFWRVCGRRGWGWGSTQTTPPAAGVWASFGPRCGGFVAPVPQWALRFGRAKDVKTPPSQAESWRSCANALRLKSIRTCPTSRAAIGRPSGFSSEIIR